MNELKQSWADGLRHGLPRIPRCEQCGTWNWYPLAACRSCGGTHFTWQTLSPLGRLHSWTRVHRAFTSRQIATPYLVGLVDLLEAPGVRIPCRLASGACEPRIGSEGSLTAAGGGDEQYWQFQH